MSLKQYGLNSLFYCCPLSVTDRSKSYGIFSDALRFFFLCYASRKIKYSCINLLVGQIFNLFNELTIKHKFLYCGQGISALSYDLLILKYILNILVLQNVEERVGGRCKEAYFKIFISLFFRYFLK